MIKKLSWLTLSLLSVSLSSAVVRAGEAAEQSRAKGKMHSKMHKEYNYEEEIKHEISFLAKKLLDKSGKEQISLYQEPYTKPFLGICSNVVPGGIQLTCITPGHNAEAAGLRSGDMIVKINDTKMTEPNTNNLKKVYFGMIEQMKAGEKMSFTVYRGPNEKTIDVTVGELSQPGYTMTIRRK